MKKGLVIALALAVAFIGVARLSNYLDTHPNPHGDLLVNALKKTPEVPKTDIVSVDYTAGTFVAVTHHPKTLDKITAKCGQECPAPATDVNLWSLPPSQSGWVVIHEQETLNK